MGLFINENEHPSLFKNTGQLITTNQLEFQSNYLTEFIKEQQSSNKSIQRSIYILKNSQNKMKLRQMRKWKEMKGRLRDLTVLQNRYENLEQKVTDLLEKIETQNLDFQIFMTTDQEEKRNLLSHVEKLNHTHEEIVIQLNDLGSTNKDIITRLDQFGDAQEQTVSRLNQFGEAHEQTASRLDQFGNVQEQTASRLDQFGDAQEQTVSRLNQFGETHEQIVSRLDQLAEENNGVVHQLEQVDSTTKEIIAKIGEQNILQQTIAGQISTIDDRQQKLITRVDNQEGLTEKVIRQIDNIRFVLYERTNLLEEKIEKVYDYFNRIYTKG